MMRTEILCMDTHDLPEADVLGPFSHLKPLHTVCDIKVMYTSIYKFIKIRYRGGILGYK